MTEHTAPYTIHVNGHTDTGEPLDRLDNRDITALRWGLDIYFQERLDHGANIRELEHLRALSRRLNDVGVTWVAEETGS